jgi:lipoprotein NlpD
MAGISDTRGAPRHPVQASQLAPDAGVAGQWATKLALTACALLMTACGSTSLNRAPVEDRGANRATQAGGATDPKADVKADPAAVGLKPLPGAENAGNPGYYTVKPGDTLIRIGLDTGQNWRDIVRWNALENPNQIEVGQVLLVQPAAVTAASATGAAATRPVAASTATAGAVPPVGAASQAGGTAAAKPAGAPASAPVAAAGAASADDDIAWIWPTAGAVLSGFDEVKNKGLDIGGAPGAPVVAAADGRVVYVGAGLRGYGNLIILKHNNTYLTAYAHNQTLLVKEDQTVRKGQKIAEMGSSDTDRVKLHFEVRRQGKPVDPSKYLPAR